MWPWQERWTWHLYPGVAQSTAYRQGWGSATDVPLRVRNGGTQGFTFYSSWAFLPGSPEESNQVSLFCHKGFLCQYCFSVLSDITAKHTLLHVVQRKENRHLLEEQPHLRTFLVCVLWYSCEVLYSVCIMHCKEIHVPVLLEWITWIKTTPFLWIFSSWSACSKIGIHLSKLMLYCPQQKTHWWGCTVISIVYELFTNEPLGFPLCLTSKWMALSCRL